MFQCFGASGLRLETLALGLRHRVGLGLWDFVFAPEALEDKRKARANIQSDVLVPKQRLAFSGALGLAPGDFRFGTRALGDRRKVRANIQSDVFSQKKNYVSVFWGFRFET